MAVAEKELPQVLTAEAAVEAAYPGPLADAASRLARGLPVLIECDKDLAPYLFVNLRNRLKTAGLKCLYLDGRPRPDQGEAGGMPMGLLGTMIQQLRDAVRGAVERRVVVLPHLDLLTTSQGGLTAEAREVIPLLYENPELVWLGFKDPSFPLPRVIDNLFPHRVSLLGVPRDRLRHLVTGAESRKFGREFNPWLLYKYVSGVNAVRLRKLLSTLEGEDYPADPRAAVRQLRQATLVGTLEIPEIDLDRDIGGYAKVKGRLRAEILDVLALKDRVSNPEEVAALEELIPRGMIFWGPPGTGKTLFAKAMATALGAAITVVSGPELKSKWVGESEEQLRQVFHRARQAAPSIIVFDELDSFASRRGTYTGSGVEHSMVNQLLTEMDGFHREELVFVVGTTNFVESLDPALLRPGRFEFHLHIPYPGDEDRREILRIYDRKMRLGMDEATLEHAVRRTRFLVPGAAAGTHFSGDHLNALCRAVARFRLREGRTDGTTAQDIERALTEWIKSPPQTAYEERVIATHEAGHAACHLACGDVLPPIERVSLLDDVFAAEGYVLARDPDSTRVVTREQLEARLCVLMGGREAEKLLLGHESTGADGDIAHATQAARELVEVHGMGGEAVGFRRYVDGEGRRHEGLAASVLEELDRRVAEVLARAQVKAAGVVKEQRGLVETLRDLLLEKKVLDAASLAEAVGAPAAKAPAAKGHGEAKAAGRKTGGSRG